MKPNISVCSFFAKILVFVSLVLLLTGCGISEKQEEKTGDLEFTVVPEVNVPQELQKMIEEKKKTEFLVSYGDRENLFIAIGYGEQPTGGYSIQVKELYETRDSIYVDTVFQGPSKKEDISQNCSYPYIVLQMEYMDKPVRRK